MRSVILVFALMYSLPLAVLAASDDWNDGAVQALYRSACAKRSGVWTQEIASLSALNESLANYADWLNKADSQGNQSSADPEWVTRLIEQWNQQKLDFARFGRMKEAMSWRDKLVSFAGEEAVTKVDKSIPHNDFKTRHEPFVPKALVPEGRRHMIGDFEPKRVQYVPKSD